MRLFVPLFLAIAASAAAAQPSGVVVEHRPAAPRPGQQATPPVISESVASDGTVITYLDGWGMERLELLAADGGFRMVCGGPDQPLPGRLDFRGHAARAGDADAAR